MDCSNDFEACDQLVASSQGSADGGAALAASCGPSQAPPAWSDGGGDPLPPPNQRENSSPSTLDGLRFLFDLDFQCFFDFHDFFHKSLHGFHGFQASQDEPEIPFRFFVLLILVRFPHFQIPFRFSDFDLYSLLPQIPA